MRHQVPDDTMRLDALIRKRFPHLSRREVQTAIADGVVTVNGRTGRKGSRVRASDRIDLGPLLNAPAVPKGIEVLIIHTDATVIAVNKPPGVPTTARRASGRPSMAGYLLERFPDLAKAGSTVLEAGLVHRLDTGTSGVLLAARTHAAWRDLRGQFRRRAVGKEYLALVHGHLTAPCELSHELAHDPGVSGRMVIVGDRKQRSLGKRHRSWTAQATVIPIESANQVTLVQVHLKTGVTHQIRAQLAAIGHPVVGDPLYGGTSNDELHPPRHLLHASRLSVTHPTDRTPLSLSCPLPADFSTVLGRLGCKKKAPAGMHRGGQ
jgi:23S rRNA pseudouridine1911/1915/1917 synthase